MYLSLGGSIYVPQIYRFHGFEIYFCSLWDHPSDRLLQSCSGGAFFDEDITFGYILIPFMSYAG